MTLHLKTRFKADIKTKMYLKALYILEKTGIIAAALGAAPKPPLASGGWGLRL